MKVLTFINDLFELHHRESEFLVSRIHNFALGSTLANQPARNDLYNSLLISTLYWELTCRVWEEGRLPVWNQLKFAAARRDRPELIRYSASAFASLSVSLPNMFDQVVVALLLLTGITFVYVIGIGQSEPHDQIDKKDRDGRR